jgi:hypothetical protein
MWLLIKRNHPTILLHDPYFLQGCIPICSQQTEFGLVIIHHILTMLSKIPLPSEMIHHYIRFNLNASRQDNGQV